MKEETIYRYFTRRTTEDEDKAVLEWIKASKQNEDRFFELKMIWHTCSELKKEDSPVLEQAWRKLKQKI
jgi:hypothetical protein